MSTNTTNTTNSTHCSAPLPVNNPFIVTLDSSAPASYVIGSVEENTYKPAFKLNTAGIRTLPYQPFFNAYLTEDQHEQTGAGRVATLVADAVISNIGEHYNTTTGEFKAPVSGVYHFDSYILAQGINNDMKAGRIYITIGPRTYTREHSNPAVRVDGDISRSVVSFKASWVGYMEPNQIAKTALLINGAAQNSAGFVASPATQGVAPHITWTGFAGYLLS